MKFRFVGGMPCPDWILAEIAEFSKITAIKFKIWCSVVVDHIKLDDRQWGEEHMKRLNPDGNFEEKVMKGMIAALVFIFEKSAKSRCSAEDLEKEMQQLGLPSGAKGPLYL
ncbi:hypothetical protein L596_007907 [Steinernema carpocapsae]|uniref:Uncharacterized protein n=1 Tax=Steinernema carpocapsae TaxID=34508 RepID=A0A4U5PBC4_STECR|nr:hypothetical protein L596_007907 [Steinernema carpocapsae]